VAHSSVDLALGWPSCLLAAALSLAPGRWTPGASAASSLPAAGLAYDAALLRAYEIGPIWWLFC